MEPIPDIATPTFTLVGGFFFDYASLLLEFHNAMIDAEGEHEQTRYAMILKFDGDLRATCVEKIPKCLSSQVPLDPKWPRWVAWARKLHQVSASNPLVMTWTKRPKYSMEKSSRDLAQIS